MVYRKITARFREKTLLIRTDSVFELLFTRGFSEIRCRASDIMYISLEFGILYKKLCFVYYRLMASCLYYSALMKCQCTKAASSETASVAYQAEFYLFYSVYAALIFIHRMICPHKRKCIYPVHFFLTERF